MCEIVEEYGKECAAESAKETETNMARKLLQGGMSVEKVLEVVEILNEEEVRSLAE